MAEGIIVEHEASTLSFSLPEFSEDVDKNIMWDDFLSICRLIFETKVKDKFPCFLADDLWKVTNCDIRFEKLSAEQVNSIVCSDVCADGDSDAENSVAKNLSDIAEEDEKYAEIVERSSSWPDYVQVRNWVFNNNSKSGSTRNADVNARTCSDVKR
ncbi:hypothetical protein HELRODRAFT_175953 [Helobdella robusta]|uniref:Uncharacterized protein n=1 Tax=Helobdella robusta TaxID=6412 RepID=T1F9Y5_HELRO|nr:hypothetical protein HELRODRAFT_175953 [Helobdella robusta]ESO00511.1 hypothetical protein HELRODRAFT_175953 [Helobdella robusta]